MTLATLIAITSLVSAPETWELRMTVRVPRVYDNTASTGYRKYQTQRIRGRFTVTQAQAPGFEPEVEIVSLSNLTHRVNGRNVTYEAWVDGDCKLWHGIGSNLTGIFTTRSVSLRLWAEPSYAVGPEPTDDNSLIVTLSGYGSAYSAHGQVAGQQGCGCAEYGHVSPTRIWGTTNVVDTASVFGTWRARRID